MKKTFLVKLTAQERQSLADLMRKGRVAAHRRTHAHILLLADQGEDGPHYNDTEIADIVAVNHRTVSRLRERFVKQGLDAALERQPRSKSKPRVLNGEGEAQLIALMCGTPPEGQSRWTLHMAADRLVELGVVESISHESVRQVLKKHF